MPQKVGKNLRKLAKTGGGPLTFIGEEGITVRFLTETDEWWAYDEWFDGEHYVAVSDDFEIPDDADGNAAERVTRRFLAAAVDVDQDKVVILKLPSSVAETLDKALDKRGTLMDRDYELSREGSGFDTEYLVLPESPKKRRLNKYDLPDIETVLTKLIEGDDEEEKPARRTSRSSKATKTSGSRKVGRTAKSEAPKRRVVRRG